MRVCQSRLCVLCVCDTPCVRAWVLARVRGGGREVGGGKTPKDLDAVTWCVCVCHNVCVCVCVCVTEVTSGTIEVRTRAMFGGPSFLYE